MASTFQNASCFICNNRAGLSLRNATNIFGEHTTLPSGKKLSEVISEATGKCIEENNVHSNVVCKTCYKSCAEYDTIQSKLIKLQAQIQSNFKETTTKLKLDYNDRASLETKPFPLKSVMLGKKLVLPASKLQPIPPDLLLKVGKLPGLTRPSLVLPQLKPTTASTLNLKVTVGTSVLTHTIKTTTTTNADKQPNSDTNILTSSCNLLREDIESIVSTHKIENMITTNSNTTPRSSILNFNVNALPQNFLQEAVMAKHENSDKSDSDDDGDRGNDQSSMEIEEDSLSLVPVTTTESGTLMLEVDGLKGSSLLQSKSHQSSVSEFLNVSDLQTLDVTNEDHKYLIGKLQLINEGDEEGDEDEEHTIVLDGENGSILRMVSGQKLIYEGGEISLVMANDDDEQLPDDSNGNDGQDDSNDETAIELQMAGDEETAKAIMAAAQEQGGAFIKVESGEMFRVQSVDQIEETQSSLVAKQGAQFKCLVCDVKSEDTTSTVVLGDAEFMMRHLKKCHDARLYICQFCHAIMRRRVEYSAHIAEHASKLKSPSIPRSAHTCDICDKSFSSRALLVEHHNIHAGVRPYTCDLCDKTFANKYTYHAHVKTHANRPRPFKCDHCGKSFLSQQNLNQHEKTHSGIKDFICQICNKAFSTQHNLEVHGVVHSGNKTFVCSTCGKAFARRAELRDHMRTHTGERPFSCEVCGARFSQRSNLHSHRRATHLDDRRHLCTLCPKRFKRRRLLEYHIKSTHTGERPLKCKTCSTSFVYPEHYKKHIRIHSGEQPYVCEICGKSFYSRDNRNNHRFVHSDKKPYECVTCGAGFMRKQLLYAHMNTSGHLAESIVVNQPRVIKVTENTTPATTEETEVVETHSNDRFDAIFEATELDTSVKSNDKATISLIQGTEDSTLLTIHSLGDRTEGTLLEEVSAEQLGDQTEIVANDEHGGVVRLIQIKLPDGNNGWVALNR